MSAPVPVSCGASVVMVKRLISVTEFCLRLSNPCNNTTRFGRELEKRMDFASYYSKKYTLDLRNFITKHFSVF